MELPFINASELEAACKAVFDRLIAYQDGSINETQKNILETLLKDLRQLPLQKRNEVARILYDHHNKGGLFLAAHILMTLNGTSSVPTGFNGTYTNPLVRALDAFCWKSDQQRTLWIGDLVWPFMAFDIELLSKEHRSQFILCDNNERAIIWEYLESISTPRYQPDVVEKAYLNKLAYRLRWLSKKKQWQLLDFIQQNRTIGGDVFFKHVFKEIRRGGILPASPKNKKLYTEMKTTCHVLGRLSDKRMVRWARRVLSSDTRKEKIIRAVSNVLSLFIAQEDLNERG